MDVPEPVARIGRRWPMQIRFTLLATAIVAVAESAIFFAVVLYQGEYIGGRFDTRLREGLERVAVDISPDDLEIAGALGVLADIAFDDLLYRDLSLALLTAEGELVASDVPAIARDLAPQVAPAVAGLGDEVELADGRLDHGRPGHSPQFRIAVRRLEATDYAIAVFASTDHIERITRTTAAAFLIALPLTLLLIAGTTWYVAGLILRPIGEMQAIARRLAPDSIPREVDLGPASPEVERLEAELAGALARIDAGYETQSRFMSNVAHELKTPISVVLTQGQTLSRAALAHEETRAFVGSTVEEMQRLGRLVESFLMLTRVREGKAAHHREQLPLNEIVMDSVESCHAMADTYGVTLAPTLLDADALVSGDADLLRTAIDNLVRNAVRFSQTGDRIEITARDDGEHWAVDVRDYGPGIPPQLIDRIFDRFAQARDEERRGRGSGLGLEIAQGIAELHGGAITVTNESPGCRFVMRLPKAIPAA